MDNVFVVIINWNGVSDTAECIASLLDAGCAPERIIVIDNGSSDNSVRRLREQFGGQLQTVPQEANLGFAAAANIGISTAMAQGAGWVLLANNDTTVARDFFSRLASTLETDPRLDIITPLILYSDKRSRVWSAGDRAVAGTLLTRRLYRNRTVRAEALPHVIPLDSVTGCGMLVRRSVFERIGAFDERFVMYGEDADFCWRARTTGFRLACATPARMWHKVSVSAGRDAPRSRYLRVRNQLWFYRLHAGIAQKGMLMAFTLACTLLVSLADVVSRQPELARQAWRAWIDGWLAPALTEEH